MIKINFLGEAPQEGGGYVLQIVGAVTTVILTVGAAFFLQSSISASLVEFESTKETLSRDIARLETVNKEVKDLEKKRAELEARLAVIAKLKRNKSGPVRILDDLNVAIPERAWLSEAREAQELIRIVGFAIDNQTIASFMKSLEKSDYFSEVDLIETRQSVKQSAKIKEFSIKARVSYSGLIVEAPVPSPPPAAAEPKKGSRKPRKGGAE